MELAASPVASPDLAEPTNIASTPDPTVSASPSPQDLDDNTPMDLESTLLTPLEPQEELSYRMQIEPRGNLLAELATLVDDKQPIPITAACIQLAAVRFVYVCNQ